MLWEDKDVFNSFVNDFLLKYCDDNYHTHRIKVKQLLELVIHRLFVDVTSQV